MSTTILGRSKPEIMTIGERERPWHDLTQDMIRSRPWTYELADITSRTDSAPRPEARSTRSRSAREDVREAQRQLRVQFFQSFVFDGCSYKSLTQFAIVAQPLR